MNATFYRKPASVQSIKSGKEFVAQTVPVEIVATVTLSEKEFNKICDDLLASNKIFNQFSNTILRDDFAQVVCIQSDNKQIYVATEGCDYARYVAIP